MPIEPGPDPGEIAVVADRHVECSDSAELPVAESPVVAKSVERLGMNRREACDLLHHRLALPTRRLTTAAAQAIGLAV
jgi:hypothetical protein